MSEDVAKLRAEYERANREADDLRCEADDLQDQADDADRYAREAEEEADALERRLKAAEAAIEEANPPTSLAEVVGILCRDALHAGAFRAEAFATDGHGLAIAACSPPPKVGDLGEERVDAVVKMATQANATLAVAALRETAAPVPPDDPRNQPPTIAVRFGSTHLDARLIRKWVLRFATATGEDAIRVAVPEAANGTPVGFEGAGWRALVMPLSYVDDRNHVREAALIHGAGHGG